jgi:hypothetical protein
MMISNSLKKVKKRTVPLPAACEVKVIQTAEYKALMTIFRHCSKTI